MNCPSESNWDLLAMEALESQEADNLFAHARDCPVCRAQLEQARRAHITRVRMYEVFDRDHDALREQLLAALPDELTTRRGADAIVRAWHRLGGYAMSLNRSAGRRAAAFLVSAACVLIAVGFFLIPGQRSAFAAALERLQRAKTIVCRTTTTGLTIGPLTIAGSGKLYLSAEYGGRVDVYANGVLVSTDYTLPDGTRVVVEPLGRHYIRFDAGTPDQGALGDDDPSRFLRELQKLSANSVGELGRDTIDGHEALGFVLSAQQVGLAPSAAGSAAEYGGQLWVDARTSLPLRYVVQVSAAAAAPGTPVTIVYDQFEWDAPLDRGLFQPDVPADYTPIEVRSPLAGEPALLQGLKEFAALTGAYPTQLDMMTVVLELMSGMRKPAEASTQKPDEQTIARKALQVGAASAYYMQLVKEDRQPEYFGDQVAPADARKILLRWTLADGGTRVVYGDLRIDTLPPR